MLLTNAFVLGFRHGVDWDHLAAIGDIVGVGAARGKSLYLAFLYAVGHSMVVVALSLLALYCAAAMPDGPFAGLRQSLEVLVGVSLVIFGVGVFISMVRFARGEKPSLISRWGAIFMVFDYLRKTSARLLHSFKHDHGATVGFNTASGSTTSLVYGPRAALGIGMLHGLGAETATQLLIIGAVGSTASHQAAVALLLSFVIGFVVSNTAIAGLFSAGLLTALHFKPLYLALGTLTAVFSIVVGALFAVGQADLLPPLQNAAAAPGFIVHFGD